MSFILVTFLSAIALLPASVAAEIGAVGGRVVIAQRSAPRTFNPVFAMDEPSRTIISLISAPLIRINPTTQTAEGILAESWKVSSDAREIVVKLRDGLRFSDGKPLTIDDVLFTFEIHLDSKTASPQRDLLIVGGQPVRVMRTGPATIRLVLSQPYAPGERLIGGLAILPKHLLEQPYREGKLANLWNLDVSPASVAGAGPFRLRTYTADGRVILERNPHYWRKDSSGHRLPYLSEVEFISTAGEDAQLARFQAGEADIVTGFSGSGYVALNRARMNPKPQLNDAGPGLDYTFLLFNLNPRPDAPAWLKNTGFRRAISLAVDRSAIAKLAYHGRATPIANHVTPSRGHWSDKTLIPRRSVEQARKILIQNGFRTSSSGQLRDENGQAVILSIVANSANPAHSQTASIIQEDMKQLGITVNVVPLEFRSLVDRVLSRRDFELAVMALRPGDADPMSDINVLTSSGKTRLWNMSGKPIEPWETEIDRIMAEQLSVIDLSRRKAMFDHVQRILADNLPFICLVSPNVLAASHKDLGNFHPVVDNTPALWNADELFWRAARKRTQAQGQ